MFGRRCWCLLAITVLSVPCCLRGQSRELENVPEFSAGAPRFVRDPVRAPIATLPRRPAPGTFGFQQLTQAAGAIFSGTVISIRRQPASRAHALETVAITFRVENAIRGVTPGESLTISQWMGLWSSGQRYSVGERLLLFLYPRSTLGLTSCVGSSLGRFKLDAAGRVMLSAEQLAAFRTDPVIGGKSRAVFSDFALAVRRASEEE